MSRRHPWTAKTGHANATPARGAIVVAGEALVDLVLEADGGTVPHLGGGSYNAARTIGRLGLRPLFIGRLSRDRYGRSLRAGLGDSSVRLDGVVETDDPTTFARVEIDAEGIASYRFYVEGTASPGLLPREALAAMPRDAAALHVGGLGLVYEPQATAVAALVRQAAAGTVVMLDPNCRPGAVRDPASYRARLRGLMDRVDVVKASDQDLVYLDPGRPPLETAQRLLGSGPSVVLVTHGALGATVVTGRSKRSIPAAPARVVDTVGAGDAFGAGWLASWIGDGCGRAELGDRGAVVRAAAFASVVAGRTCERAGAEPPDAVRVDHEWCFASIRRRAAVVED